MNAQPLIGSVSELSTKLRGLHDQIRYQGRVDLFLPSEMQDLSEATERLMIASGLLSAELARCLAALDTTKCKAQRNKMRLIKEGA